MKISNRPMRYFIPVLMAFAMQPGVVLAETLDEAISAALSAHPSIESARAEIGAADQQRREERSAYFPQLSVSSSAGRMYGDNATSRGLSVTRGAGYSGLWNGSVSARETIFNGFETSNRVSSAKSKMTAADLNLADTKENIAYKTVQAYLDVMRTREGLAMLRAHGKKIDDYLARIRKMVDDGGSDEATHQQARDISVILAGLIDDYEGQEQAAESSFFSLTGHMPEALLAVPQPPMQFVPQDVNAAIAEARNQNPSLRSAQFMSQSAGYDVAAERAQLYPDVNGELSYMKEDKRDLIGGEMTDGRAVVNLTWGFDTGGAQLARISQKKYAQAEAASHVRETEKQVDLGVRLAWSEYETAKEQVQNQDKRRELNGKLFDTYKIQFEGAKISLLQLMQGDNQLFTTDLEKMNGRYRLLTAQYGLLASMGKLQQSFNIADAAPAAAATAPAAGEAAEKTEAEKPAANEGLLTRP